MCTLQLRSAGDKVIVISGPMAVVKDEEGRSCLRQSHARVQKGWATIDLMHYDLEYAMAGTMDYMFLNLLLHCKEEGMKFFNLGMAPLANVGINEQSLLQENLAYFVFKFGSSCYSFEGLRGYKSKFTDDWEPKYTGYSHRSSLLFTVLSLVRIDKRGPKKEA